VVRKYGERILRNTALPENGPAIFHLVHIGEFMAEIKILAVAI
jgi:hypothetical protein